jgi:hypothetical protein
MEPEIAILMANLGRVTPSSTVLDPTCGSCGLLIGAAALGATRLVGVDSNASGARPRPTALCMRLPRTTVPRALGKHDGATHDGVAHPPHGRA